MNFGLTIITITYIIFLVVPGLFFKKFYFKSKFHTDFYKGAFADRLVTSIFWGMVIQILSVFIFILFIDLPFEEVYKRSTNVYESLQGNKMPEISAKQLKYLLVFFLISISISCISGNFLHNFIRVFKLDIRFSALRFSNQWNYAFRNELDTSKFVLQDYKKTYSTTEVDIYMSDFKEDRPSFYTGILKDYYLTPEGELDRISLKSSKKRVRTNPDPLELLEIKGDTFIIPYCNIANMNLRYNYSYRERRKYIPKAIQNAIILILVLSLLPVLIFPWFSPVALGYRILGTITLIFSWFIATGGTANFFDEKKKAKKSNYIIQMLIAIAFLLISLNVLGLFNVFEFISEAVEKYITK